MISMADATKLRQLRETLGITQEQLVRRASSLNLRTYLRAESGRQRVKYDTALQILEAINAGRAEKGLDPLKLDDLELNLY